VEHDPYNEVPYPTFPRRQTHPDRLGALARLFGMKPAPVHQCRVLEIGCGNGNNLIPMAYALPESHFTGVDLADQAVAAGCEVVDALGLTNITFQATDLRTIGPEFGEFDYIIAHGVYSWIAADARQRLLANCRERLKPQGVALVSYNAYPGHHVRQMLREMLLYHTRNIGLAEERMEQAREFLGWFAQSRMVSEPWRALLDAEVGRLLQSEILYHDDMAPTSDPVYFHEFASQASRHGLQYLAEADLHEMFDHRGALDWLGERPLEREQYLDFLKVRRFRQTLLCREEIALDRDLRPEQMPGFLFSSPARLADGKLEGANHVRLEAGQEVVERVARALGETYPLPLTFEELLPYAGSPAALQDILYSMVTGGFADLHVYDFPCEETVTVRPVASALARWQARDSHHVTSLCHTVVELDETGRNLLPLLDGTRDHATLAAALPSTPTTQLTAALDWLARLALLTA
jgi:SAM-dependent methyltransferase